MASNSFKVKNSLVLTPKDLSTLTNPEAGDLACDINDSNKFKRYDSVSSSWIEVGSGSGGTGGAAGDVDTLLTQNFDTATLANFTQTGLELVTDASVVNGAASARLIHQAASSRSFKQTISVPAKYRGLNLTVALSVRSSATDGNLTIAFQDETNAVAIAASQPITTGSIAYSGLTRTSGSPTLSGFTTATIATVQVGESVTGTGIPTGTRVLSVNPSALTVTLTANASSSASGTASVRISDTVKTQQFGITVPANCASMSYTITALAEANLPESYIDDVTIRSYWLGTSVQGQSQISVPRIEQQSAAIAQSTTVTTTVTGALTSSTGNGLFSYNSGTGVYTMLKTATVWASFSARQTGATALAVNVVGIPSGSTVPGTTNSAGSGSWAHTTSNGVLNSGDTFTFTVSGGTSDVQRIEVFAEAISTTTATITDLVPAKAVQGSTSLSIPVATDWQQYTPTFSAGLGTVTSPAMYWRRNGDTISIKGRFTTGSTAASATTFSLPNGLVIGNTNANSSQGRWTRNVATATTRKGGNLLPISGASDIYFASDDYTTASSPQSGLNGGVLFGTGEQVDVEIHGVKVQGWSANTTTVVGGVQQGLIQNPDSTVRLVGASGYGSTNTSVIRFTTLTQTLGSDISYASSATLGDSFTVQTAGVYSIQGHISTTDLSDDFNAQITRNSTTFTASPSATVLAYGRNRKSSSVANNTTVSCSWTGYLSAGDVIRFVADGQVINTAQPGGFTITRQGSLSQVNVNSNQKATIPTHELRFEGASARGSTDTRIVQFTSQAKVLGDGLSASTTAANGTVITVNKAGRLAVSGYIVGSSGNMYITRNQANLTGGPADSETLARTSTDTVGLAGSFAWEGSVVVGDKIRVDSSITPTNGQLNLMLQEQSVQVSVSNTLPQYSESDLVVRTGGSAGQTITADVTNIPYITLYDSTGGAWNGSQFTVPQSGLYRFVGGAHFTATASRRLFLYVNGVVYRNINVAFSDPVVSFSFEDSFSAGQILSIRTDSGGTLNTAVGTRYHYLNITQVGKPNVTGVNVTPFISIPQPQKQYSRFFSGATTFGNVDITGALTKNTGSGIYSYDSSTGIYTALKEASFTVSFVGRNTTAANTNVIILSSDGSIEYAMDTSVATIGSRANAAATFILSAGEQFKARNGTANVINEASVTVTAEALSDQILTAPETFSSDTAALTYAPLTTYTLTTLANAPVGTYITFTYAINTNARTQTTTRPTQTDADMNTNGILLYTRAYNAASTAAQPAAIAIQIGKGMKGVTQNVYGSAAKVNSGSLDYSVLSSTFQRGVQHRIYNESTGILIIDVGVNALATITTSEIQFSDLTSQNNGYFVINASKNPALSGIGLSRVAAIYSHNSGASITNSTFVKLTYNVREQDTNGAYNNGDFTVPETGLYQVCASWFTAAVTLGAGSAVIITIYVNGVEINGARAVARGNGTTQGYYVSTARGMRLNKGDVVSVYALTDVATTVSTNNIANNLSIVKVSI